MFASCYKKGRNNLHQPGRGSKSRQMSIHTNAFMTTECGARDMAGSGRGEGPMTSSYTSLNRRFTPNGHAVLEEEFSQIKYQEDIFSTITESRSNILHMRNRSNSH